MTWRWPWQRTHLDERLLADIERQEAFQRTLVEQLDRAHQRNLDALRELNMKLAEQVYTLKREGFGPAPQTAEFEPETLPSVIVSAIEERAERGSELARQMARWAERQLKTPLPREEDDEDPEPVYPDPIEVAQQILSGASMDDLPV